MNAFHLLERRRFVIAISVLALLSVIYAVFLTPQYISDDEHYNALIAGVYGQPNPYVLVFHFWYATFLNLLYLHFPSFPWYAALQYFAIYISWVVLFYVLHRRVDGPRYWFMVVLLFSTFGFFLLQNLN